MEQLVADKREGREVVPAEAPEEATDVGDLLEALRRSVDASGAGMSSTSSTPADSEDLSGLTKADLAARARELGISGRSKMDRDELARAVAEAGSSSRAS